MLRSILFQAVLSITLSCHAGVGISLRSEEVDFSRRCSLLVVVSFVVVAAVAVVAVAVTDVLWGGIAWFVCGGGVRWGVGEKEKGGG
jgi:hypothetical protein